MKPISRTSPETRITLGGYECPRFSASEEAELVATMNAGIDTNEPAAIEARNQLILSCIPWAKSLAMSKRFRGRGVDDDDLVSVAVSEGVMRAVKNLDPSKGRLTTVVSVAVPQVLLRHIRRYGQAISLPQAADDDCSATVLGNINKVRGRIASFGTNRYERAGEVGSWNCDPGYTPNIEGEHADNEFNEIQLAALRDAVMLARLSNREREALRLRFSGGLLREIGDRLGVSKERVRQITETAMYKLKRAASEIKDRKPQASQATGDADNRLSTLAELFAPDDASHDIELNQQQHSPIKEREMTGGPLGDYVNRIGNGSIANRAPAPSAAEQQTAAPPLSVVASALDKLTVEQVDAAIADARSKIKRVAETTRQRVKEETAEMAAYLQRLLSIRKLVCGKASPRKAARLCVEPGEDTTGPADGRRRGRPSRAGSNLQAIEDWMRSRGKPAFPSDIIAGTGVPRGSVSGILSAYAGIKFKRLQEGWALKETGIAG